MISASSRKYSLPMFNKGSWIMLDFWRDEKIVVKEGKYTILSKAKDGTQLKVTLILGSNAEGKPIFDYSPRTKRVMSKDQLKTLDYQLCGDMEGASGKSFVVPLLREDVGYDTYRTDVVREQFPTEKEWSSFIQ